MAEWGDFPCRCSRCSMHPEQLEPLVKLRQSYPNRPAEDRWAAWSWTEMLDEIDGWVAGEIE